MEITPTFGQARLIQQAIEAGRIHGPEEAAEQAMAMWEEHERSRAEILAKVDEAEASLARGEGIPIAQSSMRDLAESVKDRGRTRLGAETHSRR